MNQDLEHLRLLSIFYYVLAAFTAVGSLLPLFYLTFGLAMATGHLDGADEGSRLFGWFIVTFAALFIAVGLALASCLAVAGKKLARQESYTFCLVIAGVSCILMPFGTILGVITIIVLMQGSVRELFGIAAVGAGAT
ncbi:MAG: hypothetical protein K0U98_18205 [Deltaproteobacteria bacterium]|nr:hypothetical protein [Deltaproteobacteria bacterium]